MPNSYLALLRGINVGGKNRVPMKELAELFRSEGCTEVRTFIQSGNVLFDASPGLVSSLNDVLPGRIHKVFGCTIPVVLRQVEQLETVLANNPFIKAGEKQETQYVVFLREAPTAEQVSTLDPGRSPPDQFVVVGSEIYLHMPAGMADSKLTNAYFDSRLKTVSTGRNWRTVTTLCEMMKG